VTQPARATHHAGLVVPLAEAIQSHVAPGTHLHFASTPSRSNAAIREVARAFLGTRPGFRISTTGFHSMAHLLPMLGLADRLTACFFGDHHPVPQPNPLYTRLAAQGVVIDHWALWSMVASLRAGAQGDDWVVNRSLRGTTMARELATRGDYRELAMPDATARPFPLPAHTIALCAALRPDITFVHAPAADATGHVILTSAVSEGLWSALAARRGVIVTVERVVPVSVTRAHPTAISLPPHRVLAICEEPFGAHPQSLHCAVELGIPSYRDDVEHDERWRELTEDPGALAAFVDRVLRAPDAGAAYRDYVGAERLAQLCEPPAVPDAAAPTADDAAERLIVGAARQLAARARAIGARVLIAGLGQAFLAARMAQLQLAAGGHALRVLVESGLHDADDGAEGHGYLVAYDTAFRARRLSGIDDILGVLACGADNRCLAALGAAQVDRHGNLNTTRIAGTLLVGSGGACDIAASVEEAVVLVRMQPGRMVDEVEYITSPGRAVGAVVTDRALLTRPVPHSGGRSGDAWTIASVVPGDPDDTLETAVAALVRDCPWPLVPADELGFAAPITADEAGLLDALDPTGKYRQRNG
jgi:acyl CoA:acetate/3-ketoacid CoA transferase alpha subunit